MYNTLSEFEQLGSLIHNLNQNPNEAIVNGVWNRILHHFFPAPEFIICPEFWTRRGAGGSRVDLVVYKAATQRPVLVYEGKKDDENAMFSANQGDGELRKQYQENLEQVTRYLGTVQKTWGGMAYGILAQGTEFIILQYDSSAKSVKRIVDHSFTADSNFLSVRNFYPLKDAAEGGKILQAIASRKDL